MSHFILRDNGTMNPAIVGKSPQAIADLIGLTIPEGTRILISELENGILIQEKN